MVNYLTLITLKITYTSSNIVEIITLSKVISNHCIKHNENKHKFTQAFYQTLGVHTKNTSFIVLIQVLNNYIVLKPTQKHNSSIISSQLRVKTHMQVQKL